MASGKIQTKTAALFEEHIDWLSSTERGEGNGLTVALFNGICLLAIRTIGRIHTDNDLIATLPIGYRPYQSLDVPCWINQDAGVCRLYSNGQVKTWVRSTTNTSSGRVYLYTIYPAA